MPYDFSVIVPTFDRPAQLPSCLDAVERLDYPPERFEVIVVDDGSPVPVSEVLNRPRVGPELVLVRKSNGGASSARNAGAAIARGRYLAFTDDDCRPEPGWLRALWETFERHSDCIVGGSTVNDLPENSFSDASQLVVELVYAHYNQDPEASRFFASNNMAVAAAPFREIGGFEEARFRDASEDRELCDRWRQGGRRLCFAPEARVRHGNPMRFAGFARQHFRYGRGAAQYHHERAHRGSGRMWQEMGFHARLPFLLANRLGRRRASRWPSLLPLLGVWQVANAAGFVYEQVVGFQRGSRTENRLGFVRQKADSHGSPVVLRAADAHAPRPFPLVVEPLGGELDLAKWARSHRDLLDRQTREYGAVLLRGFSVPAPADLEAVVQALYGDAMEYRDRAVARSRVSGNVYTATDLSSAHEIFLHNESSFSHIWPLKLVLHCRRAATRGGETRIADVRRVFERIEPAIRERFLERGVLYRRNFRPGPFGLSWQEGFQLSDREELEAYCRSGRIDFEWVDGEHLRTEERRPGIARHPETGEPVWFNHAAVLNAGLLDERKRSALRRIFREEDLPNHTYYGDGAPIEPEVLEAIRSAYLAETVEIDWQAGDVLLLDNMLVAHGRATYAGPREVVVAMAEPTDWKRVEQAAWE